MRISWQELEIFVETWDGRCWKLLDNLLDEGEDCMSHFFTVVILPKDVSGSIPDVVKEEVAKLLAPFNEELEVPKWWEKCWCVGRDAFNEVQKQVDKEFGTIDSVRDKFHLDNGKAYDEIEKLLREFNSKYGSAEIDKLSKKEKSDRIGDLEDKLEEKWKEKILKPRLDREKELMMVHPNANKPKSNCSECGGAGEYDTTSNWRAKWDWWRIGGRWDGEIKGEERYSEDNGFNFNSQHENPESNTAPTDFLLEKQIIPFAIVTPDGEWHEEGEMGWWGMVKDKKEKGNWKEEALQIYKSWEGYIAVGCDLHI
jgi:hypothetical protein